MQLCIILTLAQLWHNIMYSCSFFLFFQKVGYKNDIGYQTILYGDIVDMRRLLMFLIERLPKETEHIIENKSM